MSRNTGRRRQSGQTIIAAAALAALITTVPANAAPPVCGNGVQQGSESCDGNQYKGYVGIPSCDWVCGAGKVGTVSCTSGCNVDCSGCAVPSTPDAAVGTPDAFIPDAPNTPDAGAPDYSGPPPPPPPPTGSCRTHSSTWTPFSSGALVIPMDRTYQSLTGMVRSLGLVWFLLKHGIRIVWVLDTNKTTPAGRDFDIVASSPAELLDRGVGQPYDHFISGSLPSGSITYAGAPFVIPATDAEAALELIHHGTLPEDGTVQFGWSLVPTFDSVQIHRAKADFQAPVRLITSQPPRRLALMEETHGWLGPLLGLGGLDFSGTFASAEGTPSNPGMLYDRLTAGDLATNTLNNGDYQMLWLHTQSSNRFSSAAHTNIRNFVDAGSGLVAAQMAVIELECDSCAASSCDSCSPSTRFQTNDGMDAAHGGHGSAQPPVHPNSPYTQVHTLEYHGLAEAPKAFSLHDKFNTCSMALAVNGQGNILVSVLEDPSKGPVFYVGGRGYAANMSAWHKVTMQRTVLSYIFMGGQVVQTQTPQNFELSRSTPIISESQNTPQQIVSFQGSFVWPPHDDNLYFNPASPSSFHFPAVQGDLWSFDMTNLAPGSVTAFRNLGSALWNGSGALPATRNVYTSLPGVGYLSRLAFNSSNDATLQSALGQSSSVSARALIERIRSAPLGGTDRSTVAYIPPGDRVGFPGSCTTPPCYTRPTMLYSASMDGMLHAFKVPHVEADAFATASVASSDYGLEKWAWVLPDQLALLRTNDQSVQGHVKAYDLFDDFLDSGNHPGKNGAMEWMTLLTVTSGERGDTVYALDVTNPDPANSICPEGRSGTCVGGPKPLWAARTENSAGDVIMGGAFGTAIGLAKTTAGLKGMVWVATNDPLAGPGQGGLRVFGLDATDGSKIWEKHLPYTAPFDRQIPHQNVMSNDVPGLVATVDKGGDKGYQTHLYVGDLTGRLWELDAATGNSTAQGGQHLWDTATEFGDAGTVANYPIATPVALYRDLNNHLHIVVVTGGIWWAPATSTIRQRLVDIDVHPGTPAVYALYTFAAGERVFAAPVVANHDVYVTASEGIVDMLSGWDSHGGGGSSYRINVENPTNPVVTTLGQMGMSGSSAGVTRSGKVVMTTTHGTGVMDNPNQNQVSTRPQSAMVANVISGLRMWLPDLK